jgi:hypothetical protein
MCLAIASWLTPLAKKSIAVHEELMAVKIISMSILWAPYVLATSIHLQKISLALENTYNTYQ